MGNSRRRQTGHFSQLPLGDLSHVLTRAAKPLRELALLFHDEFAYQHLTTCNLMNSILLGYLP
jgi:hypothetical protein